MHNLERRPNHRRLISPERGDHQYVRHIPDAPGTDEVVIRELSVRTLRVGVPAQGGFVEVKTAGPTAGFYLPTKKDHGPSDPRDLPGQNQIPSRIERIFAPLVKKPITPVFYRAYGGGRTGGGGTSDEAVRRARRKEKKRLAKNRKK